MKTAKARLDADRTAKPLTRLVKKVNAGDCVGPGSHGDTLEFRDSGIAKLIPCREIPSHEINCNKQRGGIHSLWNARHPGYRIVGAGNTADNAIRDWREQYRRRFPIA